MRTWKCKAHRLSDGRQVEALVEADSLVVAAILFNDRLAVINTGKFPPFTKDENFFMAYSIERSM